MHAYMRERRGGYTLFYDESFMNRNVVTSVTSVSFFTEMCRFVQEKGQDEEQRIYEAHQGVSNRAITHLFSIFTQSRTHIFLFHAITQTYYFCHFHGITHTFFPFSCNHARGKSNLESRVISSKSFWNLWNLILNLCYLWNPIGIFGIVGIFIEALES